MIFVKLRKMIASDTQSTDTILGTIAVAAHSLTGATGAAIAMPRDGVVVCVGRSGETAPELGDRLNVDSGISGECLRTGVILRCDDASRDYHVDAEVCRKLGLQSIAVVPLRGQQGRVGVLEAFSTESYAFTEDTMELLGRLAGLAEAAWARGVVTAMSSPVDAGILMVADQIIDTPLLNESQRDEAHLDAAPVVDPSVYDSPNITGHAPAAVPLTQVREMLATAQPVEPRSRKQLQYAAIAVAAALVFILFSFLGWKAWYRSSVSSKAGTGAIPQTLPAESAGANLGVEVASKPDVIRPATRPQELAPPRAAKHADGKIPDEVVRREGRPSPRAADRDNANAATRPAAPPGVEEVPQIEASNAASSSGAADLGNVLAATPALPRLGVPTSRGPAGGVLVRKVQPLYPSEARRMRIEGDVVIDAVVTSQGEVQELKLISGHPVLAAAAMDAVRKWRYSPYMLNGKPIPKQTRITISFIATQ